ncbi:MAG: hypothetical protein V7K28_09745 [Nostoc sp.]
MGHSYRFGGDRFERLFLWLLKNFFSLIERNIVRNTVAMFKLVLT